MSSMMHRLRRYDVFRFAQNDVAPVGRNDVMFAHFAARRNITHAVNITAEGYITCPQGQTSLKKDQLTSVLVFFLAAALGVQNRVLRQHSVKSKAFGAQNKQTLRACEVRIHFVSTKKQQTTRGDLLFFEAC